MGAVRTRCPSTSSRVGPALAVVGAPLHGKEMDPKIKKKGSSIGKALTRLVDHADVIDDQGQPRLSDPMFELWLQRLGLTPCGW